VRPPAGALPDVKGFNFSLAGAQKFIDSPTRAWFEFDQRLIVERAPKLQRLAGK
jgi:hypothetical protein